MVGLAFLCLGGVVSARFSMRLNRSSVLGSSLISSFWVVFAMETYRLSGTNHTFTPFDGPLDKPPPSELLDDIGRAIMAFSRLEYIVTALAIHINKRSASAILHDDDPNAKLSSMLKLVRRWLTKHPEYAALADAADPEFFDLLLKEVNLRNEIVHGLLESIDTDAQTFPTRRIKRSGKDNWSAQTGTYSLQTPKYLASQATLAARHFNELCKALFHAENGEPP